MNHGYEEVQINNKHYYVHRKVASEILGRELKETEVVHHIDHNRSNNNPNNLMVFKTTRDHTLFHKGFNIKKENDVWVAIDNVIRDKNGVALHLCPICNKNYISPKSNKCIKCYKEKSNCPSKEELEELLSKMSFVNIGKKYNVSDNAVRKWCKKYNLPYKYNDIKNKYKNL